MPRALANAGALAASAGGAAAVLFLLAATATDAPGRGLLTAASWDPVFQLRRQQPQQQRTRRLQAEENITVEVGELAASTGMCSNHCYRNLGFADADCACSNHGNWYMWVCNAWHGTPTKPQFCDSSSCKGCVALSSASAAPGSPLLQTTGPAAATCSANFADCRWSRCCASSGFSCFEKDRLYAQCRQSCVPGIHANEDPVPYRTPWSCSVLGGSSAGGSPPPPQSPTTSPASSTWPQAPSTAPPSPTSGTTTPSPPATTRQDVPQYAPGNKALLSASKAESLTFYVYRAQNNEDYPPENQNLANLPGVMWYLHNEIVNNRGERRFGKSRVQRFKVTTKATQPLIDAGMNFGVRYAFDTGACTGPFDCQKAWQKLGYFVGCNRVDQFPTSQWSGLVFYPNAVWYSFPGKCNDRRFDQHTPQCELAEPGGACLNPDGKGNCTYTYEEAGDISINDLEGIKDFQEFANAGGWEYNNQTDHGVHMTFWDNKYDTQACQRRVDTAARLFKAKYPGMPADADLPTPPCDFDFAAFYAQVPQG